LLVEWRVTLLVTAGLLVADKTTNSAVTAMTL